VNKRIIVPALFALVFILAGCDTSLTGGGTSVSSPAEDLSSKTQVTQFATGGLDSSSGRVVIGQNKVYAGEKSKVSLASKLASVFSSKYRVQADQSSEAQGQVTPVTTLPEDAKRVRVLDSNTILFIKDVDEKDHGKTLAIKDIAKDTEQAIYQPGDGFLIDEYVVSPDKKTVAVWDVKFADGSDQFLGGASRVVEVDIATKKYQILFTQQTKSPSDTTEIANLQEKLDPSVYVQYPLFYDANNTLYLDTFGPNGGGWGNGIYTLSATSKTLSKFTAFPAGSYSADPVGSEDGKFFVVVVPKSPSTQDRTGVLAAQADPSKIVIFEGGGPTEIPVPPGTVVGVVVVSLDGTLIAYNGMQSSSASPTTSAQRTYIYNRSTGETSSFDSTGSEPVEFTGDSLILGKPDKTTYTTAGGSTAPLIGNLGSHYSLNFTEYKIIDPSDPANPLGFKPGGSGSVEHVQGGWRLALPASGVASTGTASSSADQNNISLDYFVPRNAELATTRISQQQVDTSKTTTDTSRPGTGTGTGPWCRDMFPEAYSTIKDFTHKEFNEMNEAINSGKCMDSPLYLYPTEEAKISVQSGALIFNTSPVSIGRGWNVVASPDGTIQARGGTYDKISYDYIASAPARSDGLVVSQVQLQPTLTGYAEKLGLNAKEKADFVSFWMDKLSGTAPYIQISHYSMKESAKIVNLDIDPKPDTFVPIVMYFKKLYLPTVLPQPKFEKFERRGFVALDWSGVVE